jgi:hypothetical protein
VLHSHVRAHEYRCVCSVTAAYGAQITPAPAKIHGCYRHAFRQCFGCASVGPENRFGNATEVLLKCSANATEFFVVRSFHGETLAA